MSKYTLVTEWANHDDAIRDADTIRQAIIDKLDELGELCEHSRRMPERMQAARFQPGPEAAGKVHALADATPDPKFLTDWADAATFAKDALLKVKAGVGEQVDAHGVSGEAAAFASA